MYNDYNFHRSYGVVRDVPSFHLEIGFLLQYVFEDGVHSSMGVWTSIVHPFNGLVGDIVKTITTLLWMAATLGVQMEVIRFTTTLPMSSVLTILVVITFYGVYGLVSNWVKAQ